MRGLPPPPSDVALVTAVFDVDGSPASVGHWLFVPGLQTLAVSQLEAIVAGWFTSSLALYTDAMHSGSRLERVDLTRFGNAATRVTRRAPPNHGRWTGGQVLVASTTLRLILGEAGKGLQTVTHLPGFPDAFSDDHRTLNALGWGTVSADAVTWLAAVNAIVSPAGGNCVLGTLHRRTALAPLPVSTFSPAIGVVPGTKIATLDRRRLT
jgi:hypothetical protein